MSLNPPNSRGGLPAPWTDGGNGDVTATVDDATKTAFTIDLVDAQSGFGWRIRDKDGNTLVSINGDGTTLILQDKDGLHGAVIDSTVGIQTFGAGGSNFGIGTTGGATVHPRDPGSDGLDINGGSLDPAQGAAMIVLRSPTTNMPDNFYSANDLTINADLTHGAAKLLLKAKDSTGSVVTAEIPLT